MRINDERHDAFNDERFPLEIKTTHLHGLIP